MKFESKPRTAVSYWVAEAPLAVNELKRVVKQGFGVERATLIPFSCNHLKGNPFGESESNFKVYFRAKDVKESLGESKHGVTRVRVFCL